LFSCTLAGNEKLSIRVLTFPTGGGSFIITNRALILLWIMNGKS